MVSANDNNSRLEIESGPERGRQIILPAGGVRLGRDAANDVVIRDPALSRFQCRVYLGANGELRVEDLGSTNTTEVNGAPVQNVQMMPGDWITIGETIIRVVGATAGAAAGATEPGALSADTPAAPPAEITDLGLGAKPARPHAPRIIW
ncbi:MAG: FHA domain-containing protein, partial [Kiritimatiellaeota bacterium]|nr:FHA domain-containing protein [Kiritimatiellota bacterium]